MSQVAVDTGDVLYVGENEGLVRTIEARGHLVEHLRTTKGVPERASVGWYRLIVVDVPRFVEALAVAWMAAQSCHTARVVFPSGLRVSKMHHRARPELFECGTTLASAALRTLEEMP